MTELIFVGGIEGKSKWLNNGKLLSRNYRQGDRVYDSEGISTALTSQPVGGTGGFTSLYLINENHISDYKFTMEEFLLKKDFTYYSLFAGIGGMTMGLESLGGKCLGAWEFDPTEKKTQFAQEAHKLLHPHIPIHGDVTEINPEELEDFDLLAFTPPCQAFSVAGKRGGFEDTRGTLTFNALRVAKVKQPKILFMENVKGLVNHEKGDTLGTIIHAINEIGYTVDFAVLNSKYFDVAQNRERVYLIAIRDDLITQESWLNINGNTMIPKAKRKYQEEGAKSFNFDWCEQSAVNTNLKDFLENNVDEKYYLSKEKTDELTMKFDSHLQDEPQVLRPKRTDYGKAIRKQYESGEIQESRHNMRIMTPRNDSISNTLTTVQKDNYLTEPIEGLPIKEATIKGYSIANEGDAVNIQFPNSKTRRGRVGRQIANTLEASAVNQGVVELESELNYRIRKLTPRECLRLQSVSEEYIDKLESAFSDSKLYKFAGNGLTTNVIRAIGKKIITYL